MITNEEIQAFADEGTVVLRQVLTKAEVESLQQAVAFVMNNPGPLSIQLSSEDNPSDFTEDFRRWNDHKSIERVACHSSLPKIASLLTKSSVIRFHHDHILTRSVRNQQRTPWHQDQPYYDIEGTQTVSFWLPLDPVPKDESIEVVAGTHQGPWMMPRTFVDKEAGGFQKALLKKSLTSIKIEIHFKLDLGNLNQETQFVSHFSPYMRLQVQRKEDEQFLCAM